jgi:hypothetical protein
MGAYHKHCWCFKGRAAPRPACSTTSTHYWAPRCQDPTHRPQPKLHSVRGSHRQPLSSSAFGYRQGRTGCCLPFESEGKQCSCNIGLLCTFYLQDSMKMYSSSVIGWYLSVTHPVRPALISPVSSAICGPDRRGSPLLTWSLAFAEQIHVFGYEEYVIIHRLLFLFTHVVYL